jgi:hypothetical protein
MTADSALKSADYVSVAHDERGYFQQGDTLSTRHR